ncbi:MAG: hypothetical protein RL563_318 [Pseudomonadota bacterium]
MNRKKIVRTPNKFGSIEDIKQLFHLATSLHNKGQLQEAKALYKKILEHNPREFEALKLLATVYSQINQNEIAIQIYEKALKIDASVAGLYSNYGIALTALKKFDEALSVFSKAIELNPDYAPAYINRALAQKAQGRLDEALLSFEKALQLNPQSAEAFNNRGITLHALKRLEDALASYDKAIQLKPDYAEAFNNRGIILNELKRSEEALSSYDKAVEINPTYIDAYKNRGAVLKQLNQFELALASYEKVIGLKADADAFHEAGNVLKKLKRLDEALSRYQGAIKINPNYAEAYHNLGLILGELRRFDEALENYDKAIEIQPHAGAYVNRGNLLRSLKRYDESLDNYIKATELGPNDAAGFNNCGIALHGLKRMDEALIHYDQAVALNPDFADAYWNKSLLLIAMGDYELGWNLYEWRLRQENKKDHFYVFPKLSWRGQENIAGKKILIHSEQGLGDAIQFCRYLPKLHALGAQIIFETYPTLIPLLSTLNCPMTIVPKGEALPEFDAYCPLMSMPMIFKTRVESIPSNIAYLKPDEAKVKFWHQKLGKKNRLRVGIAWSGAAAHNDDANRSMDLEILLPLLELPIELHSLQKEYRTHDLKKLHEHQEIVNHQDALMDFSDTAALIECMDLVISVDTSVAHVAGAIGKQLWLLLPYVSDYRWMIDREDSPWYPTARLYRQQQYGNWKSVLNNVINELENLQV